MSVESQTKIINVKTQFSVQYSHIPHNICVTCVLLRVTIRLLEGVAGLGELHPGPSLLHDVEGGLDQAGGHHSVVNPSLQHRLYFTMFQVSDSPT